ncbi:eCIS core domain-containing protein [Herbaspirillum rubrisubalbicans]|uniref:eCIS core domain-containing protein n=1 Tax=Herbaspirillum rubrisubalbicans TaxID=80842 RepID=UPI0002EF2CFD|nr:DUF4157 domain-containing protein [Herbaspirillum rubrisubalbicans]
MSYESEFQRKDKQSSSNNVAQNKGNSLSTLQLVDNRPEAGRLQRLNTLADNRPSMQQALQLKSIADSRPVQKKENKTGLPDTLKSGIESLSGMSMDHVKVHYSSPQPAQLNARAYAQGSEIHLAPGQEQHLPHEAWHVVQQAQGRVQPTMQMKGAAINDDVELEREADVMGAKAVSTGTAAKQSAESVPIAAVTRTEGNYATPIAANKMRAQVQLMNACVIQRDVILTVGGGLITGVGVDRKNELGIFGDEPGDHSTAHVVFRDMIRNQLLGLTLAAAPARLQTLFDQISNLPGMFTHDYVIADHRAQVLNMQQAAQNAINTANITNTQLAIQTAAQAVLNFRNAVPMSAVREGSVGSGEGPQSGRLRMAEDNLRADPAFVLNTLYGRPPFNTGGTVRKQLDEAVLRLLDVKAVSENLELARDRVEDDEDPEYEFAPGFSGIMHADLKDILVQHLKSIRMAYPLLWANHFSVVLGDLIASLIERVDIGTHQDENY